jgi:hypothetical protein
MTNNRVRWRKSRSVPLDRPSIASCNSFSSDTSDEDNEGAGTTDVYNAVLAGPTMVLLAALCEPAFVLRRKDLLLSLMGK